jgi:hypothetical protein
MKRIILSASVALAANAAMAQMVNDTVTTGASYANNVWYSLENDDVLSAPATNWHIAVSPSVNPSNGLTAAAMFNRKMGKVYELEGSDPAEFNTIDTNGLSTWTPLENSEVSWASGALNNTSDAGGLNYGFGTYNTSSHSVEANKVFVAKLNDNTWWKFMLTLESVAGNWVVTYSHLDNTDSNTLTIPVMAYATKNFVAVNFATDMIADREPASSAWDLWFGQYKYATNSTAPGTPELITGVFMNVGVEAIQMDGVSNPETFTNYDDADWTDSINVIGSDWKTFGGMGYTTTANRVYFIDDVQGNVWRVVMNYFSGQSAGKYGFGKEKLASVGIDENGNDIVASVYPNPAADAATLVVKNVNNGSVKVYSLTGELVYAQNIDASGMTAISIPVADLANGAYQVITSSSAFVNAQKLIVQH